MGNLNNTFDIPRGAIRPYSFSQAYWDATRDKRLLLQWCPRSNQYQFFPRPVSIATGRNDLVWKEVSGKGEIYSYSVTYRGLGPFRGNEPYVVVIARLDVGVDILSNLVVGPASEPRVGLRVRPHWFPLPDRRHLLMFEADD